MAIKIKDTVTGKVSSSTNADNANKVGGYAIWVGTQAQYNAITTKDSKTIYIITE